ncbi:MAG: N-acetylmuramoyl-L-alanine amidase [Hyphomonadaceae bacterium]
MIHFIDRPSPNYDSRTREVDLVVLHYTGMQSARIALKRLTDPAPLAGNYPGPWQDPKTDPMTVLGRVSAHYVIDEVGNVYRLVAEAHRAWHAGVSSWGGEGDVNARSVGIEIVNGGHDFGLPEFPLDQINALIHLLREIMARYGLKPSRIVGHSDVAPGRKLDPGEKFPWKRLSEYGVAIWPEFVTMQASAAPDISLIQRQLRAFGYGVDETGALDAQTRAVLEAFQRRFHPEAITGAPDEKTQVLLASLTHAL